MGEFGLYYECRKRILLTEKNDNEIIEGHLGIRRDGKKFLISYSTLLCSMCMGGSNNIILPKRQFDKLREKIA